MWERAWDIQHRIERWYLARVEKHIAPAKQEIPSGIEQSILLTSGLLIMLYSLWDIWPHQFRNQYDAIIKLSLLFFGLLLFTKGAIMKVEDETNGEDRP